MIYNQDRSLLPDLSHVLESECISRYVNRSVYDIPVRCLIDCELDMLTLASIYPFHFPDCGIPCCPL